MSEDVQNTTDQSANTGDIVESQTQEPEVKTFTQEDVNGVVAKEVKKAQEKMLKSLGFEDIKGAKDGLQQLKEWQDSQKTESEKQIEALAIKDKELSEIQAENKTLSAKLSALSQGVNTDSLEDVIALAERLVTDEVSMDDAIGQVLGKYPQFGSAKEPVEKEKPPTFTVGGNPTAPTQGDVTKEDFNRMGYKEKSELFRTNPSLYAKLKG